MASNSNSTKYPKMILAREVSRHIRRICPCILVFVNKAHPVNDKLLMSVTSECKKFPEVLCYKVGWKSHLNNFQKIIPSEAYDVTVWSYNKKLMVMSNPSVENLTKIFEYTRNLLMGKFNIYYTSFLNQENLRDQKIEYKKSKKLIAKKFPKLDKETSNLNYSFEKQKKSNFHYINIPSLLNTSKIGNINNNFNQVKISNSISHLPRNAILANDSKSIIDLSIKTETDDKKLEIKCTNHTINTYEYKSKEYDKNKLLPDIDRINRSCTSKEYHKIKQEKI